MKTFSYSTFTKKQAGIIYSAVKRGTLSADKKTMNRMYGLVGQRDLTYEECVLRGHFERCIDHLIEGRVEFAQAELDGHMVRHEFVKVGEITRPLEDDEWDWEGTGTRTVDITEERWFVE